MSAKHAKKHSKPATAAAATPAVSPAAPVEPAPTAAGGDSPRQRMIRQAVVAGIWIYVAALWLLALDQTFDWGIFGPKVPPPV